ncbi:MAG: deoxyribonuclease V [Acidobacteriota bacterium]
MHAIVRHRWNLSFKQAARLQRRLRQQLRLQPPGRRIRRVAGADVAYDGNGETLVAAVATFLLPELTLEELVCARDRVRFPYVPGYLSFREVPVVLRAMRRLRRRPDLLLCDGQGWAHPRRFGLACHLGLLLDLPTIGVAKSILVGSHRDPAQRRGSRAALLDRGEIVGTALRTRAGVRPVYISPGHRCDLPWSTRQVLACCRGFRLPEPVRRAHLEVTRQRRAAA